ncbi:hypothetical protein ES703_75417 [subsurface metagenome]
MAFLTEIVEHGKSVRADRLQMAKRYFIVQGQLIALHAFNQPVAALLVDGREQSVQAGHSPDIVNAVFVMLRTAAHVQSDLWSRVCHGFGDFDHIFGRYSRFRFNILGGKVFCILCQCGESNRILFHEISIVPVVLDQQVDESPGKGTVCAGP